MDNFEEPGNNALGFFADHLSLSIFTIFERLLANVFDMSYNYFYIVFQKISVLHSDCFNLMNLFV